MVGDDLRGYDDGGGEFYDSDEERKMTKEERNLHKDAVKKKRYAGSKISKCSSPRKRRRKRKVCKLKFYKNLNFATSKILKIIVFRNKKCENFL